ncbi:hypothetical protein EJ03DRAFT_120443 [Teratosphaeria nubilosa]|uniref:Uncharacterized protein n=1 Tax=Teratosphaeria nubilosa TaxID=161662 RepID=A0A6G1L6K9_9PEZI|nr:hypothetical protein EJ03DRAFT_120443 [Teratosphaeria nubilosa]
MGSGSTTKSEMGKLRLTHEASCAQLAQQCRRCALNILCQAAMSRQTEHTCVTGSVSLRYICSLSPE